MDTPNECRHTISSYLVVPPMDSEIASNRMQEQETPAYVLHPGNLKVKGH